MFEKIKKIFKKKPKAKVKKVEEVLVLDEDKTFENEVKKPEEKVKPKDTKKLNHQ